MGGKVLLVRLPRRGNCCVGDLIFVFNGLGRLGERAGTDCGSVKGWENEDVGIF